MEPVAPRTPGAKFSKLTFTFTVVGSSNLDSRYSFAASNAATASGGTLLQVSSTAPVDVGALRSSLDRSGVSGAEIQFTTSSDVAGRVRLHAILMPFDGVCSGSAFFIHGTSKSDYATCYFNDDLQFDVTQGQTFGFGLKTFSPSFPFTNYLSAFEFSPYWRDLGGSLAGSLGAPALAGASAS